MDKRDRSKLVKLRNLGLTFAQIGKHCGVTRQAVQQLLAYQPLKERKAYACAKLEPRCICGKYSKYYAKKKGHKCQMSRIADQHSVYSDGALTGAKINGPSSSQYGAIQDAPGQQAEENFIAQLERDLKPCPCCGSEARIAGRFTWYVYCLDCEARTAGFRPATLAAQAWNRRVEPKP